MATRSCAVAFRLHGFIATWLGKQNKVQMYKKFSANKIFDEKNCSKKIFFMTILPLFSFLKLLNLLNINVLQKNIFFAER
jgi:hypothetical protein